MIKNNTSREVYRNDRYIGDILWTQKVPILKEINPLILQTIYIFLYKRFIIINFACNLLITLDTFYYISYTIMPYANHSFATSHETLENHLVLQAPSFHRLATSVTLKRCQQINRHYLINVSFFMKIVHHKFHCKRSSCLYLLL